MGWYAKEEIYYCEDCREKYKFVLDTMFMATHKASRTKCPNCDSNKVKRIDIDNEEDKKDSEMNLNELLIFGMILQADIFVDGHGTSKEDEELLSQALWKYYGATEETPEEKLIEIDKSMEESKKELVKIYRSKVQKYLKANQ